MSECPRNGKRKASRSRVTANHVEVPEAGSHCSAGSTVRTPPVGNSGCDTVPQHLPLVCLHCKGTPQLNRGNTGQPALYHVTKVTVPHRDTP